MEKRFVCEVFINSEDRKLMTLGSEWLANGTIEVVVLREGTLPLFGQTTVDQQLEKYPRTKILREESINEMQDELSGKDTKAQFFLRDLKLSWKMKAWWKGSIDLRPIEDIVTLADISRKWLTEEARVRKSDAEKRREDEALRRENTELRAKLNSMEAAKKRMEDVLYARFLSVLNEKKKKIRQLEEKLKSRVGERSSRGEPRNAYEADTEDELEQENPSDEERMENSSEDFPSVAGTSSKISRPIPAINDLVKCSPSFSSESEQDDMVLKYTESQDYVD